jgi:AcrR family transcriptional regulator
LADVLIGEALRSVREHGYRDFSVADIARRVGVSSGAPYRHFPERNALLAAAAAELVAQLEEDLARDVRSAGPDPVDRLVQATATYMQFVAENKVGMDFLLSPQIAGDHRLVTTTRNLMAYLLSLSLDALPEGTYLESIHLMEAHLALAHGYGSFFSDGLTERPALVTDGIIQRAKNATRLLITSLIRSKD